MERVRTKGVSRDKTSVFKQYRADSKNKRPMLPPQSNAALPPDWVDTYEKVNEDLNSIEEKITRLKQAHSERLKITFGDTTLKDREIATLTSQVIKLIRESEGFIKNLMSFGELSDTKVRKNVQRQLASRLKALTIEQRHAQKSYMDKLKKLSAGEEDPRQIKHADAEEFEQQQQDSEFTDDFQEIARERDEGINAVVNNLNELAMIFKDLSALVLEQGSVLDRIDFNIQQTAFHTEKAYEQLKIADQRQRSSRSAYCIMLLTIFIAVLAMIAIFKFTA
mmetsp:Transcript_253/g.290  ORF Transcript_253/g.290 Transcript_253/m.290 type:complete len:279 (+) Transcript_253:64-900(+)